jgi:prolipoprotein diacylglyceryltransferase
MDAFPDGIPIYAYGAMLFCAFIACVWYAGRWSTKHNLGVPREKFQDLAIVLFIFGLIGARLVFMWQFKVPISKFFRIWEGGIVLYGGIIGGAAAFILFHRYVLRRFNVTLWQMGDLAAPCVAIGVAFGRIGCLLNGCCWGNVACTDCPEIHFPLLTAPSREMLVDRDGLQTTTGFAKYTGPQAVDDPRTIVGKLEPGSAAEKAGLKEGDKIIRLRYASDWLPNSQVLLVTAPSDHAGRIESAIKDYASVTDVDSAPPGERTLKIFADKPEYFRVSYDIVNAPAAGARRIVIRTDRFSDLLNNWPKGRNSVQFVVEREGQEAEPPSFTPRGIGLHPTQIYEVISMVLLLFLCLAFYPYRRHDGQVWVLFMVVYSVHRFLNEILRTEPVEFGRLTLSQGISVGVLLAAIGLEIYLRKTQAKRQPLAA